MANWTKLNKEFYSVFDGISDVEWDNWMSMKDARKSMRRLELALQAKLQEEVLLIDSLKGTQIYTETLTTHIPVSYSSTIKISATEPPVDSYPLAA